MLKIYNYTLPVKLFMFTDDRSGTIKKDFEWHPLVAGVYHEVSDCVSLFGSKQYDISPRGLCLCLIPLMKLHTKASSSSSIFTTWYVFH